MLIEFSVANYRSFRDRVAFSMVASALKSKKEELNHHNLFTVNDKLKLLTSAAIYGANASGKSNLISALAFMIRFVQRSAASTELMGGIDVEPFRLGVGFEDSPSFFEIVFVQEGKQFRYGFEVTAQQVEAEWLYFIPTIREALLFEREGQEVQLGERFRTEGKDMAERTRPNALLLSVAAQFNGQFAQAVLSWFRSVQIATSLSDAAMRANTMHHLDDGELASEIVELVKKLDLDIHHVAIEKAPLQPQMIFPLASDEIRRRHDLLNGLRKDGQQLSIRTLHRKFDDEGAVIGEERFDLDRQESEGTKKLFALAGPLLETLKLGKVLILDEMDARLHPLMTEKIIKLFNNPQTNPNHAQLIFVTHDTNLLDHRLLRRDQIWFVEKDYRSGSKLYSLAEFKIDDGVVRNDASFEKDYIQGRYGAIPYLHRLDPTVEK